MVRPLLVGRMPDGRGHKGPRPARYPGPEGYPSSEHNLRTMRQTYPQQKGLPARHAAVAAPRRQEAALMLHTAHYETRSYGSTSRRRAGREQRVRRAVQGTGDAVIIDAANEHELLLEVSRATGVRRVLTTHGHSDHIQAVTAMRDAGSTSDRRRRRRDAARLRLRDPRRRSLRGRRAAAAPIHNPGHTPGSISFLLRASRCCSPATRCSPAAPATPLRRGRLRAHHRVDRPAAVHAAAPNPRAPRPRPRHDHRHRASPPPGVGRPWW